MVHDDGRRALLRIEQKARCQVHADGLVRMQQREQLRLVLQIGDTRDIQTSSASRDISGGRGRGYAANRRPRFPTPRGCACATRPLRSASPPRLIKLPPGGRPRIRGGCRRARYAGWAKFLGLFAVARHSGLRSLVASDSARFTPATSKSMA